MDEFIKIIFIKDYKSILGECIKGEYYLLYHMKNDEGVIVSHCLFIDKGKEIDIKLMVSSFDFELLSECFITLGEYRENQIKDILNG